MSNTQYRIYKPTAYILAWTWILILTAASVASVVYSTAESLLLLMPALMLWIMLLICRTRSIARTLLNAGLIVACFLCIMPVLACPHGMSAAARMLTRLLFGGAVVVFGLSCMILRAGTPLTEKAPGPDISKTDI